MLFAKTHAIKDVSEKDQEKLFQLFSRYYESINYEKFLKDFRSKDDVIILRCKKDQVIRGFSTLKVISFTHKNKTRVGIFSGDTIIDENFWGATALTFEFFKYVLNVKKNNFFKDVYWLLISKGFKTYLLLANNFQTYYPRFDKETPGDIQNYMDQSWQELYPEDYCMEKKILTTANKFDRLKDHVAKIGTDEMSNPKIAFFAQMNPNWKAGDELCCVGRVDAGLVMRYGSRTLFKVIKRRFRQIMGVLSPISTKN